MSGKYTFIQFLFVLLISTGKLSSQDFTWVKGSSTFTQPGVYGTQGVSSASNVPGARQGAITWKDASDNLWLFGGLGYPASGGTGNLNDLWKFNPVTNEWTWIKGSNAVNQAAVYGTQGVSSSTNTPGARAYSVTWIDASGNLWLFGGLGTGSTFLNDLWKFNPVNNEWTWMHGNNVPAQSGVYGTKGIAAATNKPGARFASCGWADNAGNLWLFGGNSASGNLALNDLWKYNIALNQWTWVGGSNSTNQYGVYGTQGVPGPSNSPGARYYHSAWMDVSGNLWLFGGIGYPVSGFSGSLNDLWKYNPGTNEWTWMKGSNATNQFGVYGTQGVSSVANVPGVRCYALTWADTQHNLWLFGGNGFASSGSGDLNDLWKYNTTTNEWTWIKGGNLSSQNGVYGIQGTPSPTVTPGAREAASAWIDSADNLWLFGGYGYPVSGSGRLNDLWKYAPYCTVPLTPVNTSLSNNQNICANTTTTLSATGSGTVSWYATPTGSTSLGSGTNYVTPVLGAGSYTYYAGATNACTVSLTRTAITVTVNSLPTISVNSGAICIGESFTITPTGATTYTYSGGSNVVSPTTSATYSVIGSDDNACVSSMAAVSSVTVNSLPTISVNSGAICIGESFTITPTGATTYTYSGGSNVVSPTTSATYSVIGSDDNACVSSMAAVSSVTVNSLPTLLASTDNTLVCASQPATLSVTGASTYTWSTTETTSGIVVAPTSQTTYTVNGTDANGCTNTTTITQYVSLCTGVETLNSNAISVNLYPNPNKGLFTIELTTNSHVIIADAIGKTVISQVIDGGKHSLDIHDQSSGVYFVNVIQGDKQQVIKLIKK